MTKQTQNIRLVKEKIIMWGKIFKAMDVIGKVCQFAEGTISLFMKLFSPQKA